MHHEDAFLIKILSNKNKTPRFLSIIIDAYPIENPI
jgi:hypothetical protein